MRLFHWCLRYFLPQRSSVDQRLQSLQHELNAERHLLKQNQDNVGTITSKLSQVSQPQHIAMFVVCNSLLFCLQKVLSEKTANQAENTVLKSHLSALASEKSVVSEFQ